MSSPIHYTNCPCCDSKNFSKLLSAKDYTVSHEEFDVLVCSNCTIAFTQNVATQDAIGKYYQSQSYISHSDTKDGFISKVYHSVRNITLVSKLKLVQKVTVGAGTGAFTNTMMQAGWNVTALEPDDIARSNAKSKYGLDLKSPSELFNQTAESFDAITLWHVLEHIHTLKDYLKQFQAVLKRDGRLVIAVPNYTSYDASYYKQFWAGYDVPRHLYHFSPASMDVLAKQFGFTIEATKPMWFDSVYVSMLSEQYKTGKQNLVKAFFVGMMSNLKALFNSKKCSSVIYILKKA
ncbi:MAG: class I SAM-dependent methyltransferase [Chitinophagaceae bacterium]